MSKRVAVFMKVYRNEPEIHRAVKSILTQTYQNIRFYVLVNEKTKAVIQEYADNDNRVVVIEGTPDDGFRYHVKEIAGDGNDYLLTIDGDDAYKETAIADLVSFADEHSLDVAFGGHENVSEDGDIIEIRKAEKELILNISETSEYLSQVYFLFRAIWGKLYSTRVLLDCDMERLPKPEEYGGYGGDTLFVFNALFSAERIGFCNKIVYRYTASSKGGSHSFEEGRLNSDEIVFSFVKRFLEEKSQYTEENVNFLFAVYGSALSDTISLIKECSFSEYEKFLALKKVLEKILTKLLIIRNESGLLKKYTQRDFLMFIFWDVWGEGGFYYREYLEKEGYDCYLLLTEAKKIRLNKEEFLFLSKNDGAIYSFHYGKPSPFAHNLFKFFETTEHSQRKVLLEIISKLNPSPVITYFSQNIGVAEEYTSLLGLVVYNEEKKALEQVQEIVLNSNEEVKEELFDLWGVLAAAQEDTAQYILANEAKVEYLINCNEMKKAEKLFGELVSLGVNDENMDYLRKLL